MNKMLDKISMSGNEFYTNAILSAIEEPNNNMLILMENLTIRNGNYDVLLKYKEQK